MGATGDAEWVARILTELGAGPLLYALLAAACWLTTAGHRRQAASWLPVAVLAAGQVLEALFFAPFTTGGLETRSALELSVSSGHASAAVLGWGLLARQLAGTRLRTASRVAVVVVPAVVATTRVTLGVHSVGDVLLGLLFGALLLAAACVALHRVKAVEPDQSREVPAALEQPPAPWWHGGAGWSIALVAAAVAVVPAFVPDAQHRLGDLLVYRGAAETAGAGSDVYGYRTPFGLPFTYPPFAALLAQPMARMPLLVVQIGWTALTLAAAVGVARVALRPVVVHLGLPLTVAALLVTSPARSHVRFGQVGLFLVLAVSWDLLRRHGRLPGLGVGAAIAVKLTPAVYLPWLLVSGQRGRLRDTCLWAAGLTLLGLVLLSPSTGDYVTSAAFDSTRFGANDIPGNQSVRGMLLRTPLSATAVTALWLAAAVVLVVVATRQARVLERAGNRLGAVAVLACLSLAVSPISWVHHLVWLTLPIAALVAAGRHRLAATWWALLILSPPALGAMALRHVPQLSGVWAVVIDLQGLSAVAGAVAIGALLRPVGGLRDVALSEPQGGGRQHRDGVQGQGDTGPRP